MEDDLQDDRPLLSPSDNEGDRFQSVSSFTTEGFGKRQSPEERVRGDIFTGRLLMTFSGLLLCSTVLLELRLSEVVEPTVLTLFWCAIPLGMGLLVLLAATQFKAFSSRVPGPLRAVWLMLVLCVMVFLFFLIQHENMREKSLQILDKFDPAWDTVFIPLVVFLGITVLIFFWSTSRVLLLSCKMRRSAMSNSLLETSRRRALLVTVALFFFIAVFAPFLGLIWGRLAWNEDISWHTVFVPLWICDGFFVCVGGFLLLFTCGSRDDAVFSVSQIVVFLMIVPCGIAFKVLLAVYLDGEDNIRPEYIPVPMLAVEALVCCCGADMWCCARRRANKRDRQFTNVTL